MLKVLADVTLSLSQCSSLPSASLSNGLGPEWQPGCFVHFRHTQGLLGTIINFLQ